MGSLPRTVNLMCRNFKQKLLQKYNQLSDICKACKPKLASTMRISTGIFGITLNDSTLDLYSGFVFDSSSESDSFLDNRSSNEEETEQRYLYAFKVRSEEVRLHYINHIEHLNKWHFDIQSSLAESHIQLESGLFPKGQSSRKTQKDFDQGTKILAQYMTTIIANRKWLKLYEEFERELERLGQEELEKACTAGKYEWNLSPYDDNGRRILDKNGVRIVPIHQPH